MEVTFCTFWKGKSVPSRCGLSGMTSNRQGAATPPIKSMVEVTEWQRRCPKTLARTQKKTARSGSRATTMGSKAAFTVSKESVQVDCRLWDGHHSWELNASMKEWGGKNLVLASYYKCAQGASTLTPLQWRFFSSEKKWKALGVGGASLILPLPSAVLL